MANVSLLCRMEARCTELAAFPFQVDLRVSMRVGMPAEQLVDLPFRRRANDHGVPRHEPAWSSDQMNSIDLAISPAGMAEIDRIFKASGLPRDAFTPALLKSRLIQLPDEFSDPEFLKSIGDRDARRRIEEAATNQSELHADEWIIGLYETERLDRRDIYSVKGVALAVFSNIVPEVSGSTLDFDGQWRLLKGAQ